MSGKCRGDGVACQDDGSDATMWQKGSRGKEAREACKQPVGGERKSSRDGGESLVAHGPGAQDPHRQSGPRQSPGNPAPSRSSRAEGTGRLSFQSDSGKSWSVVKSPRLAFKGQVSPHRPFLGRTAKIRPLSPAREKTVVGSCGDKWPLGPGLNLFNHNAPCKPANPWGPLASKSHPARDRLTPGTAAGPPGGCLCRRRHPANA